MEHYQHLILKALINQGGSSSESYVYQILTGDIKESNTSISDMWAYLDAPLKEDLGTILDEISHVSIQGLSDAQVIDALIEHVAKKSGTRTFFSVTERRVIDRMSDEEYELAIEKAIAEKRIMLLDRE